MFEFMVPKRVHKNVEASHEPDPCRNALIPERALHPLMHQTAVKNDRVTFGRRHCEAVSRCGRHKKHDVKRVAMGCSLAEAAVDGNGPHT